MMDPSPALLTHALETLSETVAPDRRGLFTTFASRVLRGAPSHHPGGESMLAAIAGEAFDLAQTRREGEILVRVRNPSDRPGHTVIEVLQDDRPFIVDTLALVCDRFGLTQRLVLHPTLEVVRDSKGGIERVEAKPNEHRESYVYIEASPVIARDRLLAELEAAVNSVMSSVRLVAQDHRRMIRTLRELNANLEYAGAFVEGGGERTAKIQRFLDWIVDGRFIFIGMRRYRMSRDDADGTIEAQIIPGTGRGMWQDDATSRLAEPLRGAEIPGDIHEDLDDPRIILLSKSYMESCIHRAGRLDRILVKEHDDTGRVSGFTIVVGLYTQIVVRTPGSQVPLLSERLKEVLSRLEVTLGSHEHKTLVEAFDSVPIELLVGSDPERIADLLREFVADALTGTVQILLRTHPHGRIFYLAVLLPREHYSEELRGAIRSLVEQRTGVGYIDDRTTFLGEETAVVHCFCTAREDQNLQPDEEELEEAIRTLCAPWEDQLLDALRLVHGEEAPALAARYETAFPASLRSRTHPVDAVRDVQGLEALAESGDPQFAIYFDYGDEKRETATLRMYLAEPPLLSDILPAVDLYGIRVVDAQLERVQPSDRAEVVIESLRILPLGADQDDIDALAKRLSEALCATLSGTSSSDALDGLVLGAGLDWREVDLVRAYLDYFVLIQGTLSRPYLRSVLLQNPLAVRLLVRLFAARHDPKLSEDESAKHCEELRGNFEIYRDRITALNEDRALAGVFNLIMATLRSNHFAPRPSPHRVVLKFDSRAIEGLSGVVPHREIFVHSADLMGIHLRGGPVARGGLRWSDRHDDLRTEVLGLMSTQMLKNGLIVPVGAKGGFVLRRGGLSPLEAREEADRQYRVFIASLLDVTDNLAADGAVIPPDGLRRLDGDDPYLVVAADKGTAHLSDTANEIAEDRDFWLGDAFASGGSEGYDHKKYAITARGAWECVKHHFSDLGIDPESDTYTVAGIGDMSGDVFGNGLLLMRRARLVAAFDHRHVFLDPDPDPDASFAERRRLFEMPRSTWADYDAGIISKGGGVWPRGDKSIPVPEAMRERLGLGAADPSGQELVRAILKLDVDILWNGGIGTYVRASHETDLEVGDRANDAVRIDATALRARVIGEGGNLGFTQAARVEASQRGVRLDSDAIHNSAGVDLSDHEVNFKIAVAPLVRAGKLSAAERRTLLFACADDACESVLAHNRSQSLAISIDEVRSQHDVELFTQAIDELCAHARVDPVELELPDAATIAARRQPGLTRPELSVLLGLAKLQAQAELTDSALLAADYLDELYAGYFPEPFRKDHAEALAGHRLRAEIGGLRIVNRLIDAGGATLLVALTAELGVGVPEVVGAILVAEDTLRIPQLRDRLLALAATQPQAAYAALLEIDTGVRGVARYLVRGGAADLDGARIERWRAGIDGLRASIDGYLSAGERQVLDARCERFGRQGLSQDLALDVGSLPLAERGLAILRISERAGVAPLSAARIYARLGEETGVNWLYGRLGRTEPQSLWDRMLLADLRWELLDLQREMTERVIADDGDDADAAVSAFVEENAPVLERVRNLERRAGADVGPSALSIIIARLRELRTTG